MYVYTRPFPIHQLLMHDAPLTSSHHLLMYGHQTLVKASQKNILYDSNIPFICFFTMSTLSVQSSPLDIYMVCQTYAQLHKHRHLPSVAKVISCISTWNHKHKLNRIKDAFTAHRQYTFTRYASR